MYKGFGVYEYYMMFTWSGYSAYLQHLMYLTVSLLFSMPWLPPLTYAVKAYNKEWAWGMTDCLDKEYYNEGYCYKCADGCE